MNAELEQDAHEHLPVMPEEVCEALKIIPDGVYIDGTFGRGGHARRILDRLGPQGRLLALDRDPEAVAAGRRLQEQDPRLQMHHATFDQMERIARRAGVLGAVAGILLDLGISSPQLDQGERGFSFSREGPLDMRMDPGSGEPAAAWLRRASREEMARVFHDYGEERYARRIARAIERERRVAPIETTTRLAEVIAAAHPRWPRDQHPATRCFQAIRIHINRELELLEAALAQACDLLGAGGRLAVISFHSLEDRLVKRFMREQAVGASLPPDLPVPAGHYRPRLRIIGRPLRPGEQELARNRRARSAILRVAERVAA
ncbi:MAG: 16S rRNA (cytosine(1402)-N(4))-methyltransferase RsmH [Gammaproteobacteria bacterium]|nr:MAG: 16S rRNA (cytosine(1402)-N(4))-methyltransferase RsmH [Gammaproteobacteria bacterium]